MTASETIDKQKLSFLLVPTSGLVMQEKLPKNARLFDQAKYIDQVQKAMKDYNFVDVRDTLMDHNMNIFIIRQIIIGHRQGPVWHMMRGVNVQVEKLRRKMDL